MLFLVTGERKAFGRNIVLEGLDVAEILNSLRPKQTLPQFSSHPPRISPAVLASSGVRLIAIGGIAMNIASIALGIYAYEYLLQPGFWL